MARLGSVGIGRWIGPRVLVGAPVAVPDRCLHEHDGATAGRGRTRTGRREPSPLRIKRRRDVPGRGWGLVVGGDERDGAPYRRGREEVGAPLSNLSRGGLIEPEPGAPEKLFFVRLLASWDSNGMAASGNGSFPSSSRLLPRFSDTGVLPLPCLVLVSRRSHVAIAWMGRGVPWNFQAFLLRAGILRVTSGVKRLRQL